MRIAFVAASQEPGRDGVGDYTRDLAAACEALGHSCWLVALNDRHVETPTVERQTVRDAEIEALRLPASMSWAERTAAAQRWLDARRPDWVSLQFVPYGYHPKGLVMGLGKHLAPLTARRHVHVMLHELWIGMNRRARWRDKLVGAAQRRLVLDLLRRLDADAVHTSNSTYRSELAAHGVSSGLLPLCGSIPVVPRPDVGWLDAELARAGIPSDIAASRTQRWLFGMFGSLHPVWSPEPFFTRLHQAASAAGRRVVIASIGRIGPGADLWQSLEARYGRHFHFAALGERSPGEVSTFLRGIDFGIATTPWRLIGKSATVAAMLDHGLPVVVTRDDAQYRSPEAASDENPLLYRMGDDLATWLRTAPRFAPRERLPDVAQRFVADLVTASRRSSAARDLPENRR